MDNSRKLVDVETGELIEIKEGDKLKIITAKQSEAIQNVYKDKELS